MEEFFAEQKQRKIALERNQKRRKDRKKRSNKRWHVGEKQLLSLKHRIDEFLIQKQNEEQLNPTLSHFAPILDDNEDIPEGEWSQLIEISIECNIFLHHVIYKDYKTEFEELMRSDTLLEKRIKQIISETLNEKKKTFNMDVSQDEFPSLGSKAKE